jgi:hypothetical protein
LSRTLLRDPARQRLPLLPILLGAGARQVEDGQSVARAMHVDLRVAQMRHERKIVRLQEFVELRGGARARIDAHGDEADREFALLHRLVIGQRVEEARSGGHVERRRGERYQHDVDAAHGVAQALAVRARGSVEHDPLRWRLP